MPRSQQSSPEDLPPYIQRIVDDAVYEQHYSNGIDARDDFERRANKLFTLAEEKGSIANITQTIRNALRQQIDETTLDEDSIRRRTDRSHRKRKQLPGGFNGAWDDGIRALEEGGTTEN